MKKYNRIFMIVTDSLGIGEEPRSKEFGDKGANTLYSVSQTNMLKIPTWKKLGINNIAKIKGMEHRTKPQFAYMAKVEGISNAKDTLSGHWEMMGIKTEVPFPLFTKNGFPQELLNKLQIAFDRRKIVGNKAASGTQIIDEFAHQEKEDNAIIVYTSGDSVLQICGHEKWMGVEKLWEYGQKARKICDSNAKWNVGRIIARPYVGEKGSYKRTHNRKDFAVKPPKNTILNNLQAKGVEVIAVGKINDIFVGQGISRKIKSFGDGDGMDKTIDLAIENTKNQFIFVNLVDFDTKYGHRRDPEGYAKNLNLFDIKLTKLINAIKEDDLLLITSDHGNDPTFKGSDHTRESIPVTIFSKSFTKKPKVLNTFKGLATIGNIVAKNFGVKLAKIGEDRTNEIL